MVYSIYPSRIEKHSQLAMFSLVSLRSLPHCNSDTFLKNAFLGVSMFFLLLFAQILFLQVPRASVFSSLYLSLSLIGLFPQNKCISALAWHVISDMQKIFERIHKKVLIDTRI